MKKILIVANNMEIGGAERALVGLLDAIDTEQYQVDLFLLRHEGVFMQFIPEGVKILPENGKYADLGVPIGEVLKRGHFGMAYGRMRGKYAAKRFIAKNHLKKENSVEIHYSYKYTLDFLPEISEEEYDLALGFTVPYYIVDKKVRAKKKAVWIHTDYSKLDGDIKEELSVWSAYPYIVSISPAVTQAFVSKYPSLENRIVLIENIISESLIRKQANLLDVRDEMPEEEGVTKLLSIGRFTVAKNFDNVPFICREIRKQGVNAKWYLIGYGGDEQLIKNKIKEAGMEEYVIMLGKKSNPYPYISKCDLYVQPSRYEGKAVTVIEAQVLHKPVVITKFPTSINQLQDGIDGFIVPMDNMGCANGIVKVLKNRELLENISQNTYNKDYTNVSALEQLYQLF